MVLMTVVEMEIRSTTTTVPLGMAMEAVEAAWTALVVMAVVTLRHLRLRHHPVAEEILTVGTLMVAEETHLEEYLEILTVTLLAVS